MRTGHPRPSRSLTAAVALAALLSACGGDGAPPPRDPSSQSREGGLDTGPDKLGTYRSKRFSLVLKLPGGSEWRVDDRSTPDLVALHTPTGSRIVAQRWNESEIQSRATCEQKARDRKLLPPTTALVVDDAGGLRPSGEDVRLWVALEPGPTPEAPIRGHAALVGAQFKKCWAVHYATEVPSAAHESDLSARLALVRGTTLERVVLEDSRAGAPRASREQAR